MHGITSSSALIGCVIGGRLLVSFVSRLGTTQFAETGIRSVPLGGGSYYPEIFILQLR